MPVLDDRLSPLDASFLVGEDAHTHLHTAGVQVFAGPPPAYDELLDALSDRLDLVPRYRQRAAFVPLGLGRPRWVDDPDFDLRYHVAHTALPRPGTQDQLEALAGRVFSVPLARDRPLWEWWLVEGLEDGGFALLTKTHHALVDGLASIDILTTLLEDEPSESPSAGPLSAWRPRPSPGTARLVAEALLERTSLPEVVRQARLAAAAPADMAKSALGAVAGVASFATRVVRPAPRTPYNVPISAHKRFVWRPLPLAQVKAIKDAAEVSLNDVVLAAVAGALRRHLRRRGVDVDGLELRVFVPVATRSAAERGRTGNQVTGLTMALPVGERDPVRRLGAISAEMDERKESAEPIGGQALTELGGFAVPGLLSQASRLTTAQRVINLVVTNVPGPQQPLYLLGRRLEYIAPMVPLGGNLALGAAIVSYNGTITFGFFGDWAALHDLGLLADDLLASIEELAEVSGAD